MAIAMVPLIVIVVLLGKYQAMRTTTVAASRSLAFECAARPQACADPANRDRLANTIWRHHFEPSGAVPRSGEAASSGYRGWNDRSGRALLRGSEDLSIELSLPRFDAGAATAVGRAATAGIAGSSGAALPAAATVLQRLAGPSRFGFEPERGMVDARVSLKVASDWQGRPGFLALEPPALVLRANTAILAEPWMASSGRGGPDSIAARVNEGARLDAAREGAIVAGYAGARIGLTLMGAIALEPAARHFRFHDADPLVLPPDRIGAP